jgi:hypothetical protein
MAAQGGGTVSDFAAELRLRFRQAQQALREARETGDDYAADVRAGELDSLRRTAAQHGIELDDDQGEPA